MSRAINIRQELPLMPMGEKKMRIQWMYYPCLKSLKQGVKTKFAIKQTKMPHIATKNT